MQVDDLIPENVKNIQASIAKMMMLAYSKYPDAILLGQGIPNEVYPPYILEDIKKKVIDKNEFNKYSPMAGLPEFREKIAKHLMSKYKNHSIDPEKNILVTCGAAEACAISLAAVTHSGDEVILFSPCYPSHIDHIYLAGGKPVFVPLDFDRGWALDIKKLEAALTDRTRAIIICNPSNPTGSVFSSEELSQILDLVRGRDIFILNDETYNYLVYEPEKFCSLLDVTDHADDKIFSCFSFSKEFAMTGLRVGYMYLSEKMLRHLLKIHVTVTICAPTISQQIGLVMLGREDDWALPYYETFRKKREILMAELDKGREYVSYNPPVGAYYMFIKYHLDMPSSEVAVRVLDEANVVTIPGSSFGPFGEGYLRISFAASEDQIREGARRLIKWFEERS